MFLDARASPLFKNLFMLHSVNTSHITSNISGPSSIPISTSSALDGALGPPPARTSQQAKQVRTTYSSGKSSGVAAPVAERTQNEMLNPQDSQQKVIEFFKVWRSCSCCYGLCRSHVSLQICPFRYTKHIMERVIARLNARAQPPDMTPLIYHDPYTDRQENLTPAVNLVIAYLSVCCDAYCMSYIMSDAEFRVGNERSDEVRHAYASQNQLA